MLGLTPMVYQQIGVVLGAAVFGGMNTAVVCGAITRIRSARFASERRRGERFAVEVPGVLNGVPCRVINLSMSGALVQMPAANSGAMAPAGKLVMDLPDGPAGFACKVRPQPWKGEGVLSVEFDPGQGPQVASMARALFWDDRAPRRADGLAA
jgi:hypothetical protein